jgi:hypothetical protein
MFFSCDPVSPFLYVFHTRMSGGVFRNEDAQWVANLSHEHVVQVACGMGHTAAVTRQGRLYTWGWKYGSVSLEHALLEMVLPRQSILCFP